MNSILAYRSGIHDARGFSDGNATFSHNAGTLLNMMASNIASSWILITTVPCIALTRSLRELLILPIKTLN